VIPLAVIMFVVFVVVVLSVLSAGLAVIVIFVVSVVAALVFALLVFASLVLVASLVPTFARRDPSSTPDIAYATAAAPIRITSIRSNQRHRPTLPIKINLRRLLSCPRKATRVDAPCPCRRVWTRRASEAVCGRAMPLLRRNTST
jgi:hypothetical protein